MIANTWIYLLSIDMSFANYLSDLFLGKQSVIESNFIYTVVPVLSITVLMFSLRSIFQSPNNVKMKKQ